MEEWMTNTGFRTSYDSNVVRLRDGSPRKVFNAVNGTWPKIFKEQYNDTKHEVTLLGV